MAWLAHYGVPKSQWSDEARRRYDAQHRGKGNVPWPMMIGGAKREYDRYQEQNHNRGGNRSNSMPNKVDESRVNARRSRTGSNSSESLRNDGGQHVSSYRKPSRGGTNKIPTKPDSGQHVDRSGVNYRSRSRNGLGWYGEPNTRDHSSLGKPTGHVRNRASDDKPSSHVRNGATGGKNASRRSKNTPTTQAADAAISRNMRSGKNSNRYNKPTETREERHLRNRANSIAEHLRNGGRMSDYFHNGSTVKQRPDSNYRLSISNDGTDKGHDLEQLARGKRGNGRRKKK